MKKDTLPTAARTWTCPTSGATRTTTLERIGGRLRIVRDEYRDSSGNFHRDSLPAVTVWHARRIVREEYFQHGERHRLEGPAIIDRDGNSMSVEFYRSGQRVLEPDEQLLDGVDDLPGDNPQRLRRSFSRLAL
jgi:hypothetical protein